MVVGQDQHMQRPQSNERSHADMAQVVASQLQEPRAVRDASGNMLEPVAPAVHQVGVLITDTLVRAQRCALNRREKGFGEIKSKKA